MSSTHRIDGPKCPRCHHPELDVTFAPCFGWGLPDGCSQVTYQSCPRCDWNQEGPTE